MDESGVARDRYRPPVNADLLYGPAIDFGDVDDGRHETQCFVEDTAHHAVVEVAHVDLV